MQLGISIRDLDLLTIGMVNDMYVESRNDEHKYAVVATKEDFNRPPVIERSVFSWYNLSQEKADFLEERKTLGRKQWKK